MKQFFADISENSQNDRAPVISKSTQQTRIGNFDDQAPVSQSGEDENIPPIHITDTVEVYHFDDTLSREYILGNYDWTTDQTTGAVVSTHNFPNDLFNQAYVWDIVKRFQYMVTGIRISVRVSSNAFCSGKLIASYVPNANNVDYTNATSTVYRQSGSPHMLVSATAAEVAIMDIPFVSPKRKLDIYSCYFNELAYVKVVVLNQLRNTNGTTAKANVTVSASFINSALSYTKTNPTATFVPQSAFGTSTAVGVKNTPQKLIKSTQFVSSSTKEAIEKSKAGVISTLDEDHTVVPGEIGNSVLSTFNEGMEAAKNVLGLAAMVGLDKPRTQDANAVVDIKSHDWFHGNGIDKSSVLSVDVDNSVTVDPQFTGCDQDDMNLNKIMSTPTLARIVELNSTSAMTVVEYYFPWFGSTTTYLDWVLANFSSCSGTFKTYINITAATTQCIKLVFYITINTGTTSDYMNTYHKIVDVQGDTEVMFMVPFLDSKVAFNTRGTNNLPRLCVKVLSWSTPDEAATAPISLNVYRAGAGDWVLARAMATEMVVQSAPREIFKQNFEPFHPSFAGYTHKGLINGENVQSVRDMIHISTPYYQATSGDFKMFDKLGQTTATENVVNGIELWAQIFLFWRGSVRMKFAPSVQNQYMSAMIYNAQDVCYMKPIALSGIQDVSLEVEMPFYSDLLYQPVKDTYDKFVLTTMARGTDKMYFFKSAGDDFTFLWLNIPNTYPRAETARTNVSGYRGFQTWSTTAKTTYPAT